MQSYWIGSFVLILLVASATSETVDQIAEESGVVEIPIDGLIPSKVDPVTEAEAEAQPKGETGDIDYEAALRPATHKKRSISNIIKLLLGGNVPPNHPLVKQPEPKSWSLAENIIASLPGSLGHNGGWGPTAAQQIQHLFATKAKIIPYTGQVASGLTGIASVKGDILKQIHSLSTAVIAQAAAEAAAKAVAGAAAAHAVTGGIAQAVAQAPHAIQKAKYAAIKGKAQALKPLFSKGHGYGGYRDFSQGWYSTNQNTYASPVEKTPGDQPGPPYYAQSAQGQQYQAPNYEDAYAGNQDYAQSSQQFQGAPSTQSFQQQQYQPQQQQQQGYYNIYNPYDASAATDQRQRLNDYSTLPSDRSQGPVPQVQASAHASGRDVKEPPSILSSLATLIAASTSAYNTLNSYAAANPSVSAAVSAATAAASNSHNPTVSGSSTNPIYTPYQPSSHAVGNNQNGQYRFNVPQQSPVSLQQSGQQALPSSVHPSSYPFGAQHVPQNAAQYSPQTFRNSPNANAVSGTSFGRYGGGSAAGPGYSGNNGGTGSSFGFVSRYGSQPSGSSPYQATSATPGGHGVGHAGQAPGNFNSPPGAYSAPRATTYPFGGQTQNVFSPAAQSTQGGVNIPMDSGPVRFTLTIPVNGPATVLKEKSRSKLQPRISEEVHSYEKSMEVVASQEVSMENLNMKEKMDTFSSQNPNPTFPSLTYEATIPDQASMNIQPSQSTFQERMSEEDKEFFSVEPEEIMEEPKPEVKVPRKSWEELMEEERAKSLSTLIQRLMKGQGD